MADQQALILKLARLAHETWCEHMIQQGWRPGAVFDADARIHDAIVPFDQLNPVDRRSVYLGIVVAEIVDEVKNACDYPRGAERELNVTDVRGGLRVRHCDTPSEIGTVESWEEDSRFPGALNTIRVRWDSGELIDHAASEREIRPLDEVER